MHVFLKLSIGVTQMVLISEAEVAGEGEEESSVIAETLGHRHGGRSQGGRRGGALARHSWGSPPRAPAAGQPRTAHTQASQLRSHGPAPQPPTPGEAPEHSMWEQAALPQRGDLGTDSHLPAIPRSLTALHSKILNSSSETVKCQTVGPFSL